MKTVLLNSNRILRIDVLLYPFIHRYEIFRLMAIEPKVGIKYNAFIIINSTMLCVEN